eukprot:Clim_evm85s25 gene=Clim_evmTU85s25
MLRSIGRRPGLRIRCTFVRPRRPHRYLTIRPYSTESKEDEVKERVLPKGIDFYPPRLWDTHSVTSIEQVLARCLQLQNGKKEDLEKTGLPEAKIVGRIAGHRKASTKLYFLDIVQGPGALAGRYSSDDPRAQEQVDGEDNRKRLQAVYSLKGSGDPDLFKVTMPHLAVGDLVEAIGTPGRTKIGEPSLFVSNMRIISPCLLPIPRHFTDPGKRARQRTLDMLINPEVGNNIVARSTINASIRNYLLQRDFVEVETPTLWNQHGGASARPFQTRKSRALGHELFLRVAPELFLKRLVVGGLPKVFEIGKQFRNEAIDADHSPEFTSCEFYCAYEPFEKLFEMTEGILSSIAAKFAGDMGHLPWNDTVIDYNPPYPRLHIMDVLAEHGGEAGKALSVLDMDAESSKAKEYAIRICREHNQHVSESDEKNLAALFDKAVEAVVLPKCPSDRPCFVVGFPAITSPLAKVDPSTNAKSITQLVSRFEVYVAGMEICNAYLELNDPKVQRERFAMQQSLASAGDEEAQLPDEEYCQSLEYGLPPTIGWGMGIDRVVMLMSNTKTMRDVLAFPMVKQVDSRRSGV